MEGLHKSQLQQFQFFVFVLFCSKNSALFGGKMRNHRAKIVRKLKMTLNGPREGHLGSHGRPWRALGVAKGEG